MKSQVVINGKNIGYVDAYAVSFEKHDIPFVESKNINIENPVSLKMEVSLPFFIDFGRGIYIFGTQRYDNLCLSRKIALKRHTKILLARFKGMLLDHDEESK